MHPERYLMPITSRPPMVMHHGQGSFLWDEDGRRYLDLLQGWAVNALGHAPAELVETISQQAAQLLTPSPALHNRPQLVLAERLCTLAGMDQAHLATTGAEANEAALKLARKWGRLHRQGAYEILTTHNSFHGRSLALMAASGKQGWERLFPPHMPGFVKVPFGDVAAMRAAIGPSTVAMLVEPIQGEGGVVVPPDGYLRALRGLADEHDLLLMLDEVQTGIVRTGALFACQHEAIRPDVMTLGKGLGAGVTVSAVLANKRASCFEPGDQGGTFNGNPLGAAVALRVLDIVTKPGFIEHVTRMGAMLREGLDELARELGGHVRGRGLLLAWVLDREVAAAIVGRAQELGLLVNAARPNILRMMPSLRISGDEVGLALSLLRQAARDVRATEEVSSCVVEAPTVVATDSSSRPSARPGIHEQARRGNQAGA
jgi:acetylornithine/N-succinyldiaminopimelate aminotransferase